MKLFRVFASMAIVAVLAMASACGNVKEAGLNKAVEEINNQLSQQKIPGIDKVVVSVEDKYVVYNYIIDEESSNISDIRDNIESTKDNILQTVLNQGDDTNAFVEFIKSTDRGLKMVYKGNKSGEEAVVVFENSEL